MNRLVILRLSLLLLGMPWASLVCAQERQFDGHWEGAIAQPAGDVKSTGDFTSERSAAKGSFTLPAAAIFQWPLSIDYAGSSVKFRLPNGTLFNGELQRDTIS